jgi:hypothetical protein
MTTTQVFTTIDPKEQFEEISEECEAKVRKSNAALQDTLEFKFGAQVRAAQEELRMEKVTHRHDLATTREKLQDATTELKVLIAEREHQQTERSWAPQEPNRKKEDLKPWAFVMIAYDEPGHVSEHLWGVIAMARTLQLLSKYPLLVLTNTTHFPDGSKVDRALAAVNAKALPVKPVPVPSSLTYKWWIIAWWKIQVWALTEYEKLIWLDSDAIIYRSVDYIFERSWMWAQRDDWECGLNQGSMCSGIMLLFPSESDYKGILQYANSSNADLSKGDQKVIMDYFTTYTKRPISLLSDAEAAFGQCIGTAQSPYLEPDSSAVKGLWNIPSFVHKSGGWASRDSSFFNVCFQHNVSMQLFRVGSTTVNVCHFHPLGAFWRSRFCEGVAIMGLQQPSAAAYCSDDCWVRGIGERPAIGLVCGPAASGVTETEYFARTPGLPVSLLPSPTETVNLRRKKQ